MNVTGADSAKDWYARALSIPRPDSIEGLQKLDWKDFELYALLVVSSMYKRAGLTFSHTPFSKDQGRDGEAEYVLGLGLDKEFQITFRVWLEVKKRGSEHVGKGDIGVHLVDASFGKAHTIIFVTNSKFAAPLKEWLSDYVRQTGIQYKLINGEDLLDLSRRYLDDEPLTRADAAEVISGDRAPSVHAICWFSFTPADQRTRLSSHPVIARTGRLLYLNIELSVNENSRPFVGRALLKTPRLSAADCQPYPAAQAGERFYAPGDSVILTYSIWPGSLRNRSPSDFVLSIESTVDVRLETRFANSFDREYLSLPDVPLGSQESAYAALREHVSAKIDVREGSLALLIGPAGAGKSHVLSLLRRHLAGYSVRELNVDCDNVQNDRALFEKIIRDLLPLPTFALDADVRGAVIAWCTALRLSDSSARSIADDICRGGDKPATLTPRDRAELLAMILGEDAGNRSFVITVEDLHKAAPSLISLLLEVFSTIEMTGRGNVHFVLSSRPYSADISEVRNTWLSRLGALSHARAATVFTMAQPSRRDAEELVSAALCGAESYHIEALIDAVGTSPYDLRECLLYLLRRNALRLASNENAPPLEVANPLRLRLVLHSPDLRQATEERLKVLLRNQPEWLRTFLLAGAAYGRSFPLAAAAGAAAVDESSEALDASLAECGLWSVAALSTEKPDWIEFDHDLIRDALLRVGPPRTTRRAAGALYAQLPPDSGDALRARIAYQAGMAAAALEHAKTAAQEAKAAERFEDVVELNQLSVQILDPNMSSIVIEDPATDDVFRLDAGIRHALPSRLPGLSSKEVHQSVLHLLVDNLSCLASTGSGSSVLSEKTLSEASALAERLADSKTKARLLSMEGRLLFERDHVKDALALHMSAEKLFKSLQIDRDRARAENFIRLAICERTLGHVEESMRYLHCAMRTCERRDWSVLNKIRNNLGALYLKSDWKVVRYHWNKQIAHAERHALASRVAHGLLSLGFVDLFEDALEAGFERTERGRDIAERLHIDNQRVRAALNLSVYYIRRKSYTAALDWLREGEKVALRHHIGRRLWRVIANMAVVHELLGQPDLCALREAQVIELLQSSESASIRGRQLLPLVNVALRALTDLPIPTNAYDYAEIVRSGRARELPNMLGNYCVDLPPGPRFLLTE